MKSTNWVVNGVLALAIVILYVLHFSGDASPSKQATLHAAGGAKVAYFEIDSIQNKYDGIILAVSHKEFLKLELDSLKSSSSSVIFDTKAFLDRSLIDSRL